MSEIKERTISLLVTENCNLNCIYCYEHNKTKDQMSFDVAKEILNRELNETDFDGLTYIDLFGGEPFLNFELIKEIYEYVISIHPNNIRFFTTTNGTLIHGDVQQWLIQRKEHFTVGLSLDGVREAHNINRSNSFDSIDLDFFLDNYPNQSVKMTVSAESLPYFADSIKFLTKKGFKISCNLAYMIDWSNPNNSVELEKQLSELIDFYVANPEIKRCQMLNFKIEQLGYEDPSDGQFLKYCGAGTAMKCYTKDGHCYPCQLFTPLSAGHRALKSSDGDFREKYPKDLYDAKCINCYVQRICPFCLGSNYLSTGNMFQVDENRCRLYKMIFKANAKLNALLWNNGDLSLDAGKEQALLRSIVAIQEL